MRSTIGQGVIEVCKWVGFMLGREQGDWTAATRVENNETIAVDLTGIPW